MPNIKILHLTGIAIKPYIPMLSRLRAEVLQDYPYLAKDDLEKDMRYLKYLSHYNETIAVIILDGTKVIGFSIGIPMEKEISSNQIPLVAKNYNLSHFFYFSMSILLKKYHSRGFIHHFFDIQEQHVYHLKRFKRVCFNTVQRPENHSKRPRDYLPLDTFWKKRGYIEHPEIITQRSWIDIDDKEPSFKPLIYWIKNL